MGNRLINRGILEQQDAAARQHQETDMAKRKLERDPRPISRCMLYNETGSQIFVGKEAIEGALDDGWKDEPAQQTAQAAGAAAFDRAAADRLQEFEELLQDATDAADELTERATKAEQLAAAQTKRADSAEKKLAAAEKKLAANARK